MSTIARFLVPTLAVVALLVLTQNFAPRAHAGNSASAVDLMILDGDSADLVVTVTITLTEEDVDIGAFGVELVETDFIDSTYMDNNGLVPLGAAAGETVMVDVKFTLKCVNNEIEGLGLTEHAFEIHVKEVNSGSVTVTCAGEALVEFDPDPLEIAEGETKKVTATVTKLLTQLEANSRTINLRLQEKDEDTHLGRTPNTEVKLAGKKNPGQKVTFSWRFVLECRNNEIRGIQNTGKAETTIAIEFEEGGPDYGDGTVRCKPVETSSINSGGSHPSDVFVDEETGLAYALNAFDGAIGVFDGATQVNTLNLPCPYVPSGASSVDPQGFNCIYQGFHFRFIPQGAEIYAADFQAAWIVVMFFGSFDPGTSIAGTPDSITAIPVGDSPSDIEYDPIGNRMYVANSGDGTVSVINPDSGVVEDTIATGGSPGQIAIDGVNGFVYVTDFIGDQVFVIDTSTRTVVDTIPAGNGADGIVFDPDTGELYVTNFIDDTLSIIELAQPAAGPASLPTTVPTGNGPIEVDVNPLTDRIFVANAIDDTVTVIDRSAREVVATIPVGLTPDDVTVDTADGLVYVANHDVNTLTLIENASPFTEQIPADVNCDGLVDIQDGLHLLKAIGLGQEANGAECPFIGANVEVLGPPITEWNWGDLDCNGEIDGNDPLELIRRVAGFAPTNSDAACWGGDPIMPTYIY